ncbi:hypothetical protein Trydic_g7084 [Trypoxylus dichotomus]
MHFIQSTYIPYTTYSWTRNDSIYVILFLRFLGRSLRCILRPDNYVQLSKTTRFHEILMDLLKRAGGPDMHQPRIDFFKVRETWPTESPDTADATDKDDELRASRRTRRRARAMKRTAGKRNKKS